MSVQILDLTQNRKGFESHLRDEIVTTLVTAHDLDVYTTATLLSARPSVKYKIHEDALVIIVLCHGEVVDEQEVTHGNVTYDYSGFSLDTSICETHYIDMLPSPHREATLSLVRDPSTLPSRLIPPKGKYAVIWYVCNSNSDGAALPTDPRCAGSLAFSGEVDRADANFICELAELFHSALEEESVPLDEDVDDRLGWYRHQLTNATVYVKDRGIIRSFQISENSGG